MSKAKTTKRKPRSSTVHLEVASMSIDGGEPIKFGDKTPDMINSPPHYTAGKFESIEVIEDQGHGRGFCYGNALKYLHRAPHKGTERADLLKAIWYVERLVAQLDGG